MSGGLLNEICLPIKSIKSLSLSAQAEVFTEKGIPYGYISGIINQYIPLPLQGNFYPKQGLASPEQWQQRVLDLDQQIRGVNLQLVAGIPAVIVETLESLCQHYGVSSLKHQFPELRYSVFGGTDLLNLLQSLFHIYILTVLHL